MYISRTVRPLDTKKPTKGAHDTHQALARATKVRYGQTYIDKRT